METFSSGDLRATPGARRVVVRLACSGGHLKGKAEGRPAVPARVTNRKRRLKGAHVVSGPLARVHTSGRSECPAGEACGILACTVGARVRSVTGPVVPKVRDLTEWGVSVDDDTTLVEP